MADAAAAASFELFSRDGGIYDQTGARVSVKGVNWFGLETHNFALHGLWAVNMEETLDFVAQHFNAIRMPFSCELALDLDGKRPDNINYGVNPALEGLTTGACMDAFVRECAKRGILVMLDMHRLAAAKDIPDLWYDADYPEQAVLRAWRTIVLRYKDCWNVFAADLNNEPHGCASWGDGNVATDWQLAAERLGKAVLDANPKLLVFVEGVERNACVQPGENCWWGGHVAGAAVKAVTLPVPDKLVYSPHVYGPDVHKQPYFGDPSFPANMPDIWARHFGFVKTDNHGPAICFGEWGGWGSDGPDRVWQDALAAWMVEHDITDSFYWCLNPNSGDTGGVLQDDWKTPHAHKLEILDRAHPNPTRWAPAGVDVAPAAPPQEDVDAGGFEEWVDPAKAAAPVCVAAAAAAPAAAAAAAAPAAAQQQPKQPPPGELVFEGEGIAVRRANAWQEGAAPCVQYDVQVTNTTGAVARAARVIVAGADDIAKSWNCGAPEPAGDDGATFVFGLPEWCAGSGLQPGADFVMGVIARGTQPTSFAVEF